MDALDEESRFPDDPEARIDFCRHGVSFDDRCPVCIDEMHAALDGIADAPTLAGTLSGV